MGLGRTGRRRVGSPRTQPSHLLSRTPNASQATILNISPEARTKEILCKPMEEHNERSTTGLSAVYSLFICGTTAALPSWLLTSGLTPIVSVNLVHARHLREPVEEHNERFHNERFTTNKSAIYSRFTCGLPAGRRPLFFPGC